MSERKERPTCQREDERLCIAPGRLSERKSSTTQSDNIYVHIVPSLHAESAERCVCGWQRRQPWKLDKTEAKVTPLRQCCGLLGGGEYDCVSGHDAGERGTSSATADEWSLCPRPNSNLFNRPCYVVIHLVLYLCIGDDTDTLL